MCGLNASSMAKKPCITKKFQRLLRRSEVVDFNLLSSQPLVPYTTKAAPGRLLLQAFYLLVFWENVLGRVERSKRLGSLVQLSVDISRLGHNTLEPRAQIVLSSSNINPRSNGWAQRLCRWWGGATAGRGED